MNNVSNHDFNIFSPLLKKIDILEKGRVRIIAIDGGSASGKTTLAAYLCKIYDATIFHMDDFFLTPEMRTRERLYEVGGNVDRERFLAEVLLPLSQGMAINYRPFDCSTGAFKNGIEIIPKSLVIIEGAYSMHPLLADYYDLSVFLDIGKEKQVERILKRNSPQVAKRFFEEWIPLENIYFKGTSIKKRCNLVISV